MNYGRQETKQKGGKIKAPFGVAHKPAKKVQKPRPAEPDNSERPTFAGAFANSLAPMLGKLPVKILPDYKPFAEAGIELTKK